MLREAVKELLGELFKENIEKNDNDTYTPFKYYSTRKLIRKIIELMSYAVGKEVITEMGKEEMRKVLQKAKRIIRERNTVDFKKRAKEIVRGSFRDLGMKSGAMRKRTTKAMRTTPMMKELFETMKSDTGDELAKESVKEFIRKMAMK
jgi:hypothetical protein